MTIQENISRVDATREKLKNHHMCAKYEEDDSVILVIYPEGDFVVGGIRVNHTLIGKAKAMETALANMDHHWSISFPGYKEEDDGV